MKLSTITIFLFFFTIQMLLAQKDKEEGRFTATIVAGVNISQIDGDEDGVYGKVGFNAGARGGVRFGDKMELCTEILFSQKGSYIKRYDKMYHLDYMEVPVLFYYKDWEAVNKKNQKYMRVMLGAGLSYSRLLNTTLREGAIDLKEKPGYVDPFLKDDLMVILDANFFFTKNIGLNLRWSRSILTIVGTPLRSGISYAINRSIIIRLMYKF
jgi:hypothetical protein